jgi:hypothetical protein
LFQITSKFVTCITLIAVSTSLILASCSSATTQTTNPASGQQSSNQPAQKPGSSGQPPGNENMTTIMKRTAEILGISTDKFTTTFQNAMPKRPSGSDQQGGQPPAPPSGQSGQPPTPPADQQITQSQMMTEVYAKIATELNISADSIAKAMSQAEKELKK